MQSYNAGMPPPYQPYIPSQQQQQSQIPQQYPTSSSPWPQSGTQGGYPVQYPSPPAYFQSPPLQQQTVQQQQYSNPTPSNAPLSFDEKVTVWVARLKLATGMKISDTELQKCTTITNDYQQSTRTSRAAQTVIDGTIPKDQTKHAKKSSNDNLLGDVLIFAGDCIRVAFIFFALFK